MSIKEEVLKEPLERLVKLGLLTKKKIKGKWFWKDSPYSKEIDNMDSRTAFLRGLKKGQEETKQKMIEEFKEMIDKKLEGFKKVRQGIIGNTKVLTAYNCFIAHLEELKGQLKIGDFFG
jgi:hypothetical protein